MLEDRKDVIIVPWDFTESCEVALMHAVQLAKEVNSQIILVRFVESPGFFSSKNATAQLIESEKLKLNEDVDSISKKHNITPLVDVLIGFETKNTAKYAKLKKANLLICGDSYKLSDKETLDVKDLSKKLNGLDIPFITAFEKPSHTHYKEIVVPLNHDKKYKETLHWLVYLSKYYNCNINIIKPFLTDEYQKKEMANNIYFTKKMLDKKNIVYGIKTAKKNRDFSEETLRFATDIDSDLVLVMKKNYSKLLDTGIINKKTPIMVINRNSEIIKYGGFN